MRLRKWGRQRGAIMVEFAVVLPLFLLIAWCIVDFARAFYTANSLATAVREGARFAAVRTDPASAASVTAIKNKVQTSFNAFGGSAIPADSIFVIDERDPLGQVTVRVRNYVWLTTTPINVISGGKIKMTKQSTFRWEQEPTG